MNLNREAILNTGVCYWSGEDDCYIVESPLCDRTGGIGETPKKAWEHFVVMIDEFLKDLKTHELYMAPGRPAKGTVNIHVQVQPETRETIKQWQKSLKVASQGEVLDYLAFFYDHLHNVDSKKPRRTQPVKAGKKAGSSLSKLNIFGVDVPISNEQREKLNQNFMKIAKAAVSSRNDLAHKKLNEVAAAWAAMSIMHELSNNTSATSKR